MDGAAEQVEFNRKVHAANVRRGRLAGQGLPRNCQRDAVALATVTQTGEAQAMLPSVCSMRR